MSQSLAIRDTRYLQEKQQEKRNTAQVCVRFGSFQAEVAVDVTPRGLLAVGCLVFRDPAFGGSSRGRGRPQGAAPRLTAA